MRKVKLFVIGALICGAAHADEWWEASTQAGGRIILTTQVADWCPKSFYIGYIETSKQDAVYGCWMISNERIHMKFNDGTIKIYDREGWVYKNDKR